MNDFETGACLFLGSVLISLEGLGPPREQVCRAQDGSIARTLQSSPTVAQP